MLVDEDKIEKFWQWFVKNDPLIKRCIENESAAEREVIVEQLNNFILDFGMFTWDIGLDDTNSWFFTISPNGDTDLLVISERIIDEAPNHLNWHFHSSRPAKKWDRKFSIYNNEMDLVHIDASGWHYIAFEETDGKIELQFEAENLSHLDEETTEYALNTFLVNEIGEKILIMHISTISTTPEFSSEDSESKYTIHELRGHLSGF